MRKQHGLSQQQLAERLTHAGLPAYQSMVARMETGKRAFDLDTLYFLAKVLDTTPLNLITPEDVDEHVVVANVDVLAYRLRDWLRGFNPLPGQDKVAFRRLTPFADRVAFGNALTGYIDSAQRVARALARGEQPDPLDAELENSSAMMANSTEYAQDDDFPVEDRALYGPTRSYRCQHVDVAGRCTTTPRLDQRFCEAHAPLHSEENPV